MGVRSVTYKSNIAGDTFRGPSEAIWADCPVEDLIQDPRLGQYFFDDFVGFPSAVSNGASAQADVGEGQWTAYINATAASKMGTSADTTNLPVEGGVLGLTCGTNNNLTLTLAANQSTFRLMSPAAGNTTLGGQKLWFETSIAVSTVTSGAFDLFVGLMDTGDGGTRITSAADLVFSAANTIKTAAGNGGCIGFWKRATSNPADVAVVYNVNNGVAQLPGASTDTLQLSLNYAGQAMAAWTSTNGVSTKPIGDSSGSGFLKLGFVYDPYTPFTQAVSAAQGAQTAGSVYRKAIKFFVNGKEISPFFDISNIIEKSTFPNTWMAPVIGFRTGGSGAGVAYVDFVRAAQLASS